MGDDNKVPSFSAGPGQDQVKASQEEPKADGSEPKYVTVDEVQRLVTEGIETAVSRAQSITDKANARIAQRVQQIEATHKQLYGEDMPDELRQKAQTLARNEVLEDTASAPSSGGQAARPGDEEEELDPETRAELEFVDSQVTEIEKEYGIELDKSDPEAKPIEEEGGYLDYSSARAFLKSYETAVKAKQERIQRDTPGRAKARTPALGTGGGKANPINDIVDPGQLIKMGLDEL